MLKKYYNIYGILGLALCLYSCDVQQKVLKSNNPDYKYAKAIEWYNSGKYYQAMPVLEELITLNKGTKKAEDIYWKYTQCYFRKEEYLVAAYHFKNFREIYPSSDSAEPALYNSAICYYKNSPKNTLDQTDTKNAIDAFQLFINSYPNSPLVKGSDEYINKLRRKLELKALDNAHLYYKTEKYRAASIAYKNILQDFPDIDEAEEVNFMITKSAYLFAENSILTKQTERYADVVKYYSEFKNKYPISKYITEGDKIEHDSYYKIIESSYKQAESLSAELRPEAFQNTLEQIKEYKGSLSAENSQKVNTIQDKAYLESIKSYHLLAEYSKDKAEIADYYKKTIETYQSFVDKFSKGSKFANEAEKMYLEAASKIKTLN